MDLIPSAVTSRAVNVLGQVQYRAATSLVRRAVGLRKASARVGGVFVPYLYRAARSGGDGEPPVVLVHGFGGDKESWLVFAGFLRRARGLLIPDLPGFGAAGAIPRERASARAQAEVVVGLLDHVGARRAHLVGNSMGGGISLRVAYDHPERVASLSLLGSVGPVVEKSEVGIAVDRGENPLLVQSPRDLERLLSLVAEKMPPATRAMREYLGEDRFARRDAQADLFEGWVHGRPEDSPPDVDLLARIDAPSLVVHGEKDRVIHPATARALAEKLPNARLEMLAGVGHVPQIEAPKQTAARVERFIRALPR